MCPCPLSAVAVLVAFVSLLCGARAGAQAPDRAFVWRSGTALPVPCGGHAVAVLDGRVLSAGGTTWQEGQKRWLSEVNAYDPVQNRWHRLGVLPEPVGYAVAVGDGTALYLLGGASGTTTLRHCWRVRSTPQGLAVDPLPDLPEPRVFAAGGRIGRTLYLVGGASDVSNLGTATASLFTLDLNRIQDGWRPLAPLPGFPRATHAAVTAGNSLFLFGGCHLDDKGVLRNLADAYRYDPQAATWERLPDMPAANRALTALDISDHEVALFGGFTATEEECAGKGDAFGFTADVIHYDATARTYYLAGKLPTPIADAKPARCGEELFLLGGEPAKRQRAGSVLVTDLAALRTP